MDEVAGVCEAEGLVYGAQGFVKENIDLAGDRLTGLMSVCAVVT